jgi:hypothetical protein
MAERPADGETGLDLLWAAIAGLRADVARLVGRLERTLEPEPVGDVEAVAEAWRKRRQEEVDRMLAERGALGKGEALDLEDEAALERAWMDR